MLFSISSILNPIYTHNYKTRSSYEMSGSDKAFWLRCEKKEFERRAALTPTTAKKLIDAGFEIFVERDEQRIFDDSEYETYVPCLYRDDHICHY